MNLKELKEEQKKVQIGKNRFRSIPFYEYSLDFRRLTGKNIIPYIRQKLDENEEFIWTDLGAGNEFAIREAKYIINNPNFKTYSVDILDKNNIEIIKERWSRFQHKWSVKELNSISLESAVDLLNKQTYAPKFFKKNIESVKLPEKADLITAVWVMQYSHNASKVFKNAKNNLKDKGIFMFNTDPFDHVRKEQLFLNNLKKSLNIKYHSSYNIIKYRAKN